MDVLFAMLYVILGVLVGSLVSAIPSIHIYNIAPLFILMAPALGIPGDMLLFFLLGNVIGYAIMNALSVVFFSAPDDTTFLVLMPGQILLLSGRGFEAAVMIGLGGLFGAFMLAIITPILPMILPPLLDIVTPHLHWLLALVTFYILISEFPKDIGVGKDKWKRFKAGWRNLSAGYLTFLLSALLGFIIMNGNIMPVEAAYFGLLPAFIGLFAIPSLIMNIVSRVRIPEQRIQRSIDSTITDVLKGGLAGFSGGIFAAIIPALTGGVGAVIAGQAVGQKEESQFLVSMGANRFVYYVGAFFLLFVPGFRVIRGGLANIAATVYLPNRYEEFYAAAAGIAIGGVLAFILMLGLAMFIAKNIHKIRYDVFSAVVIVLLAWIVWITTRTIGLIVMIIATGIGLIPLVFASRRLHCLAVILVPLILNMAGLSEEFAILIGLR